MAKDFYSILGVPRNATSEQIRARFLQVTREKHPDRFSGAAKMRAEEDFQNLTQAFNVLTNPDRRREHDVDLARPTSGQAGGTRDDLLKAYMQRGVKAYKEKKFIEAADNFKRATVTDPNSAKAWHHLALACSQEKRWLRQAVQAVTMACDLEPMKASYHKLGGKLHARAGDKEKALEAFRQALQWGGDDAEIEQAIAELEGRKKSLLGGIFGKSS